MSNPNIQRFIEIPGEGNEGLELQLLAGPYDSDADPFEENHTRLNALLEGWPGFGIAGKDTMDADDAKEYIGKADSTEHPVEVRSVQVYSRRDSGIWERTGETLYGATMTAKGQTVLDQEGIRGAHASDVSVVRETRGRRRLSDAEMAVVGALLVFGTARDAIDQGFERIAYMLEKVNQDFVRGQAERLNVPWDSYGVTVAHAAPVREEKKPDMVRTETVFALGALRTAILGDQPWVGQGQVVDLSSTRTS